MKIVKESLNEINFERGISPKEALGIGPSELIKPYSCKALGYDNWGVFSFTIPEISNLNFDQFFLIGRAANKSDTKNKPPAVKQALKLIKDLRPYKCKRDDDMADNYSVGCIYSTPIGKIITVFREADYIWGDKKAAINLKIWETPVSALTESSKLNEVNFERGKDPREAMNIGKKAQLMNDMKKIHMDGDEIDISDKFVILPNKNAADWEHERICELAIKYMPNPYSDFVKHIRKHNIRVDFAVEEAYKNGMDPEDIKSLLVYSPDKGAAGSAKIALTKITRTPEKIEEDEEENVYIFIGYTDKVPTMVNGKKYYEEKFMVENMIKIDKYNPADLSQVTGMKLRVRYQEHKYDDYAVYMLKVPKFVMDEESYHEIPEHLQDIVEKYKEKI
jgi:hypothetical protein